MSVGEEKLKALGYERTGWEEETYFGKEDMVQFNAKGRYVYIENGMSEGVDISMEELKALYEICKERGWIESGNRV